MEVRSPAQSQIDFERIATAIRYLETHAKEQPSLERLAQHLELSPQHFQRLFTEWAGTSPKKFLQYLTLEHAKELLTQGQTSLLEASLKTGVSSPSRLHDVFVTVEGMTPGEYKNGGEQLMIKYQFATGRFGEMLIASTMRGVCYIGFVDHEPSGVSCLKERFPQAAFVQQTDVFQTQALRFFTNDRSDLSELKLHLKGTPFQLKVWQALLTIPTGQLVTYGAIAESIDHPKAYRAVGTAVGQNPVSFLIPCHRVIQASGALGNYHWGSTRKSAMIGWESAHRDTQT